jgi:hypothetical protein
MTMTTEGVEKAERDTLDMMVEPITQAARHVAYSLWSRINSKGIFDGKTLAAELCRRKGFHEAADAIIEDRDMPF